ncbi:28S ribosomal protein S33, mitochondrial-like [Haliotis rubra]|uniref:28S ribosomal protein S33, mitochondrial-like n=1 Tax=Haliotis rubra TaxID=36100 RepID=UPI001EE59BA0|nr:28S ribosomal protein S33, mitochondrial-like [Haliotis rubra]XP_046563682.1 28S ribosomal protein S33, mitochondrial-like [Haliotis rubra]
MASNYAKRMGHLAARIFGEVARPTSLRSMKVVRLMRELPPNLNPEVVNYYPRYKDTNGLMIKLRKHGLFRDEHLDFQEEMTRLKALRGKVKPKKGEGKRAMKRK